MAELYAGTSGLVLPVPNKSHYPAEFRERSRLCYYGSLFNSLEVNASFYKVPQPRTVANWAAEVPEGFRFTFKLWRDITHVKDLAFNPGDVSRFMQAIDPAGEKSGCLLVQFPPGAKAPLLHQLIRLVDVIHHENPKQRWKIALEFRNASWFSDHTREFAEANGLSIVLQDIPTSATPMDFALGDTIYLRFHGPGGKYRGSYDDSFLQEYSTYIREWQDEGKTVYAYFNNTMGDAVSNLITLNSFIQQLD